MKFIPGHFHINEIIQAIKLGVAWAGGTPIEIPSIGICDGISMNHSGMNYPLASRELIADSIEAMTIAHKFDALVLVGNCDKIDLIHGAFEAIGSYAEGNLSDDDLNKIEQLEHTLKDIVNL